MNFEVSPDEQEFLNTFESFCLKEIAPMASAVDEAGELPRDHYRKLGEIGFLGLLHEEKYGGQNSSLLLATMAQSILSESCGSSFFSAGASAGLFGGALASFGNDEQKQKYLPSIIRGNTIGALGVTEPDAGSDVSGLRATAVQKGDEILINGQKTYITNAPICDVALILARYTDASGHDFGLTHFIVDMSLPGVSKGQPMKKLGLKGSPTGEIFLEDVRVPTNAILGRPGRGFRYTMETFTKERLSLAAYSVGVMTACVSDCKKYSKTRKTFGRPIAKHQSVAFMLADMLTRLDASRLHLYESAWLADRHAEQTGGKGGSKRLTHNGEQIDIAARASTTKLLASTAAREVTNMAVQLHGGAGFMEEYRVARMYRDIKLAEIGGGTSEIQKGIIARAEAKRVPN